MNFVPFVVVVRFGKATHYLNANELAYSSLSG